MSASSLIFLLIVAIWAAYLLQHWVRRREHLATARSVDRFSEAMRVLERRDPLPESPVDAAERRSYSVGLARPSRPSVTVKRAAADGPAPRLDRPRPVGVEKPGLLARAGQLGRRVNGRRVRGISLLVAVIALLALAVLVPVLGLPSWALGIAGAIALADLAWLRGAARRSAPRQHAVPAPARPPAAPSASADDPRTFRATSADAVRERRCAHLPAETAPPAEAVLYDGLAASVEAPAPASREERDDVPTGAPVDPHGWQPVPVPPPTYTLKAKAERRHPPAAEVVEAGTVDDPVFDGAATGSQPGPVDYSRVPTGELPFDGYALDEDLEELPAAYQAV